MDSKDLGGVHWVPSGKFGTCILIPWVWGTCHHSTCSFLRLYSLFFHVWSSPLTYTKLDFHASDGRMRMPITYVFDMKFLVGVSMGLM
jgi:hypothetical protein